jgi:hypothetical protein
VLAAFAGELEFDEFVLILTTKLGVGRQQQSSWQEGADGTCMLEVGQGACLGAAALTQGLVSWYIESQLAPPNAGCGLIWMGQVLGPQGCVPLPLVLPQAQEGLIVAMEDTDLLLLQGNVYSNILTAGVQSHRVCACA